MWFKITRKIEAYGPPSKWFQPDIPFILDLVHTHLPKGIQVIISRKCILKRVQTGKLKTIMAKPKGVATRQSPKKVHSLTHTKMKREKKEKKHSTVNMMHCVHLIYMSILTIINLMKDCGLIYAKQPNFKVSSAI